jgi:hypothetical protein
MPKQIQSHEIMKLDGRCALKVKTVGTSPSWKILDARGKNVSLLVLEDDGSSFTMRNRETSTPDEGKNIHRENVIELDEPAARALYKMLHQVYGSD